MGVCVVVIRWNVPNRLVEWRVLGRHDAADAGPNPSGTRRDGQMQVERRWVYNKELERKGIFAMPRGLMGRRGLLVRAAISRSGRIPNTSAAGVGKERRGSQHAKFVQMQLVCALTKSGGAPGFSPISRDRRRGVGLPRLPR